MGKYTVTSGQNIYDVTLHIYGSIEGISDLLMSNPKLSLGSILKKGDVLTYSDNSTIDSNTVTYFTKGNITPANGDRNVYPKTPTMVHIAEIFLSNSQSSSEFSIVGTGKIEIDWGDNSNLETISLSGASQKISHYFNNTIPYTRKIKIYGTVVIKELDTSSLKAEAIYLLRPLSVQKYTLKNGRCSIDHVSLMSGVHDVTLTDLIAPSLKPLITNKELMTLDISGPDIAPKTIDEYLIQLVKEYGNRRNCTVKLTTLPSGVYQEPLRDKDLEYIITSGMEAIWVIVHEPTWNEGGLWKFIINNIIYSA